MAHLPMCGLREGGWASLRREEPVAANWCPLTLVPPIHPPLHPTPTPPPFTIYHNTPPHTYSYIPTLFSPAFFTDDLLFVSNRRWSVPTLVWANSSVKHLILNHAKWFWFLFRNFERLHFAPVATTSTCCIFKDAKFPRLCANTTLSSAEWPKSAVIE